ncbi:MAG: YncE family protein [Bacteroides sp.]|nr:YncE family protein [Bacteroides sp.]
MKRILFAMTMLASVVLFPSCNQQAKDAGDEPAGTIIIGNKSGDDVYFLDRVTGEILAMLPTGVEPHEVEVSDDGRYVVICNYGNREIPGNTLSVYDVEKAELIRTIDLGEHTRPHGMDWMDGTDMMLVTTEGSQSLLVVDVGKGEVLQALSTGQEVSHMVAVTPDHKRAFVSSIRTGNVTVFDLESGELIAQLYSGVGAEGIAVSPQGHEVWVTNRGENTLAVFDTNSMERLATIDCGDFPIRCKFSPDGSLFVVSNARSGDVAVFDANERSLLAKVKMTPPVPEEEDPERYFADFEGTSVPIGLVVPDNQFAYVANTRSDAVTVISLETFEIIEHFAAGKEPDGINFSPLMPAVRK